MTSRQLTDGERLLVVEMFGQNIDCSAVTINTRKWWPLQPRRVVMAPDGHIWCHPRGDTYRADYSHAAPSFQALFIHEMTHIWQHQSGIYLPLRRHPFCRYRYTLVAGKPLRAYGLEQQAEIISDAFLALRGVIPPSPQSPWRDAAAGL
jgi:hypothetical protein